PPFGAALGNPEMTGRQTVRATFRCGAGQSGNDGAPNCTRHLSVRRWAIRKWRGAKLYAPGRKMPPFQIGNCLFHKVKFSYVHPSFRMDTN
ncbi:MAG: hypothetical protein ACLQVJ_27255, partial [Syntrophobacteraceae bacterium]